LHLYCIALAVSTFILLVAGGLVTSTGSGLSVPDWPLSYGRFFPPMIGGIRFEHSHRVIALVVGVMTLGLCLGLLTREKRQWMKFLGLLAFFLVAAQAVLGAITVIYLLPKAVSVAHAAVAQSFFGLTVSLILFTSREWREGKKISSIHTRSLRNLLCVTTLFVFLQLVLGALVRHDPKVSVVPHLWLAGLIALHTLFIFMKISRDSIFQARFLRYAGILGFLVIAQGLLGLGAFTFSRLIPPSDLKPLSEVFFRTAHQATGALILAGFVILTLRSFRLLERKALS
jgi:heme a synthase